MEDIEVVEENEVPVRNSVFRPCVFHLISSDSESSSSDMETFTMKKRKLDSVLPPGFLDLLPPEQRRTTFAHKKIKRPPATIEDAESTTAQSSTSPALFVPQSSCKQFWKAGDYEGDNLVGDSSIRSSGGGMDYLRVHPRFLHSNATNHKWALGAIAELLDNSLDEVCNGATYVNVDVILNRKDNSKMLIVEDDGGGMSPDKLRHCMSLGYSLKSKLANTIGQYGNGFKTSTMRLGADVIVFTRCLGADGFRQTQSIGMLSYTFLRRTKKEDIVVPMIDYELRGLGWKKLHRSSSSDWDRNLETILGWSPYETEEELFKQFNTFENQGTRIVIYNLWEDDEGQLELDFDADKTDIQIRGVNRDEQKIEMAKLYPNSKHFLTYQHSLRSYASILYLRIPPGFRMILRGKDIDHHNLVNDMTLPNQITYRPVAVDGMQKSDPNMVAVGTVGFVKDARSHIDIQGFNVYHKNRLVKPFWRVWNTAGSDGRGVIGVLEANFVEPAHDKQGFERTIALARLEARLVALQRNYWSSNCQEIGYAPRRKAKSSPPSAKEKLPTKSNGKHELEFTKREEKNFAAPKDTSGNNECSNRNSADESNAKRSNPNTVGINSGTSESIDRSVKSTEDSNVLRDLEAEREKRRILECRLQKAEEKMKEMDKEYEALIETITEDRCLRDAVEERLRESLKEASSTILELVDYVILLESRIELS